MHFLKSLLNHFLFSSTMFFAAGAPAVGGGGAGAGSGDAGGGAGAGSGGAPPIATWGPPTKGGEKGGIGESGEVRTGDETEAETAGPDDFGDVFEGEDFEAGETEGGDQTFKQFIESITSEIRSEDPKVVKQAEKKLKRLHGENQQFKEQFESPEQARELTERLESLGGIEGIETETQEAATLWNMLGAGDPAILDTLAEDHGEGLIKLFDPYVDRMAKVDPAGYAHKFAKIFMATMNEAAAGQISALAALNQLMTIEGVKDSAEFQRVAEVINQINEVARQAPEGKRANPELSKKEKDLQAREAELKRNSLSGKAAPVLQKSAKSAITDLLGTRKLNPEATKQVLAWTHDEFAKLTAKDATGKRNRESLLAAGETEKWLKNVKSTANRFMAQAAKTALRKYAGISGLRGKEAAQRREEGNSRREAGGGGQSGGTIRSKAPDPKDVDWARMRAESAKAGFKDADDMFMFGRTYYKKGDSRNTYKF